MSSSEEKEKEIDIRSLLAIVQFNLHIIFSIFLLSIVTSVVIIKFSTPIFEAETIIGPPNESKANFSGSDRLSQLEAFVPIEVGSLSSNISSTDLIPKILGEQFLKTLLKSDELVSHLQVNPDCGDKTPSLRSITGVLVFLNLYEFKSKWITKRSRIGQLSQGHDFHN